MDVTSSGLAAVSSLDDPVRARLYDVVSASPAAVGRDEAAAAAGIGRPLAAYHLDKLVELGLLTATYQRPAGRDGPGAGRPAKLYARSGREFAVTVPPREYELAARLLAVAVDSDTGGRCTAALQAAARQHGANLAARGRAAPVAGSAAVADDVSQGVRSVLRQHGFEPCQTADGAVELRNCPFRQLAALHPDMVCGMNLAIMNGLVEGFGPSSLRPELDPQPGRCCVVILDDSQRSRPAATQTRTAGS
jgi:predicted ArsR family transcriptional regulator